MMKLYTYEELVSQPDPTWVVDGWIAEKDIGILFGPTQVGKSFIALDLLHHVAMGRAWCGLAVKQAAVLYIAAEGAAGIPKRVRAWASQRGIPIDARYLLEAVQFDGGEGVRDLIATCEAATFTPKLIVIDTLSASMIGGDESTAGDIGVVVAGAQALRDAFKAAVFMIDHTGWDESRERGSSSKRQRVEVVIECKRVGNGVTQLTTVKSRDAKYPAPVTLRLETVDDSLVPYPVASEPDALTESERSMLAPLMSESGLRHGTWLQHSGTAKTTFNRLLPDLLSRKIVEHFKERYSLTPYGLTLLKGPRSQTGPTQSLGTECPIVSPTSHFSRNGTRDYGHQPVVLGTEQYELDERRGMAADA